MGSRAQIWITLSPASGGMAQTSQTGVCCGLIQKDRQSTSGRPALLSTGAGRKHDITEHLVQVESDNISSSLRTEYCDIHSKELQHGSREQWRETPERLSSVWRKPIHVLQASQDPWEEEDFSGQWTLHTNNRRGQSLR